MADAFGWIAGILILAGTGFAFIAAVGVLRLPDFYTRLHAATKAATLALGLLGLAFVVHLRSLAAGAQAFVLVLFVFLTAPVAAQMLGRAAYRTGLAFWSGTEIPADPEFRGRGADRTSGAASETVSDDPSHGV